MAAKENGLYPDLLAEYRLRIGVVDQLRGAYRRAGAPAQDLARWAAAAELVVAIEYDQKRFARDLEGAGGEKDKAATAALLQFVPDGTTEAVGPRQTRELDEARATLADLASSGFRSDLSVDGLVSSGVVPARTVEE